jgi:hypothetical protein
VRAPKHWITSHVPYMADKHTARRSNKHEEKPPPHVEITGERGIATAVTKHITYDDYAVSTEDAKSRVRLN